MGLASGASCATCGTHDANAGKSKGEGECVEYWLY
jgi:hypothetical protein